MMSKIKSQVDDSVWLVKSTNKYALYYSKMYILATYYYFGSLMDSWKFKQENIIHIHPMKWIHN